MGRERVGVSRRRRSHLVDVAGSFAWSQSSRERAGATNSLTSASNIATQQARENQTRLRRRSASGDAFTASHYSPRSPSSSSSSSSPPSPSSMTSAAAHARGQSPSRRASSSSLSSIPALSASMASGFVAGVHSDSLVWGCIVAFLLYARFRLTLSFVCCCVTRMRHSALVARLSSLVARRSSRTPFFLTDCLSCRLSEALLLYFLPELSLYAKLTLRTLLSRRFAGVLFSFSFSALLGCLLALTVFGRWARQSARVLCEIHPDYDNHKCYTIFCAYWCGFCYRAGRDDDDELVDLLSAWDLDDRADALTKRRQKGALTKARVTRY